MVPESPASHRCGGGMAVTPEGENYAPGALLRCGRCRCRGWRHVAHLATTHHSTIAHMVMHLLHVLVVHSVLAHHVMAARHVLHPAGTVLTGHLVVLGVMLATPHRRAGYG